MMDTAANTKLYSDVKSKLKITWENESIEAELTDMIADAEIYMNHLLGAELDYSAPGFFHRLFLNYCLYARNNCENEFEDAYRKEINRCRAYVQVQQSREESDDEDEQS